MILKYQKGITLIESVIYIAIIGLIMTSFVGYSLNVSNNREKIFVEQTVQDNLRNSLLLITQKVRDASSVNIGNSDFNTNPGLLYLNNDDVLKNPTIIYLDGSDKKIKIKEGTNATSSITGNYINISELTFNNLTGSNQRQNIQVFITIEYLNPDSSSLYGFTQSATTTINLRR
jgi:type II secretory pathway pseudopilin PulG